MGVKEEVTHLEKLLKAIKKQYPQFVEAILGFMGYLTDEQFYAFTKWLEDNPELSTDDITRRVHAYMDFNDGKAEKDFVIPPTDSDLEALSSLQHNNTNTAE